MLYRLGDPPYNLVLHPASKRWLHDPALHWCWQLWPRLTRTAGFERGTGVNINTLTPKDAALLLCAAGIRL
jgi:UDPglucose--hexose-1-phosphate uridylyltransferase